MSCALFLDDDCSDSVVLNVVKGVAFERRCLTARLKFQGMAHVTAGVMVIVLANVAQKLKIRVRLQL